VLALLLDDLDVVKILQDEEVNALEGLRDAADRQRRAEDERGCGTATDPVQQAVRLRLPACLCRASREGMPQ
jgi:hypothetical protein